jgi:hypothetical protein
MVVSLSGRWDLIFYLAAGILILGVVIWDLFAAGDQIIQ